MIKGQNTPLTIVMSDNVDASKLHALLYGMTGELVHWTEENAQIEGNTITLPITEEESLTFPPGRATLEVKLLDSEGIVQFLEVFQLEIENRHDTHRLTGGE